jgi:anti-anti-sigma factor
MPKSWTGRLNRLRLHITVRKQPGYFYDGCCLPSFVGSGCLHLVLLSECRRQGGLVVPEGLRVSVTPRASYVVLTLAGESDFANGRQLRDELVSQLSRGARRLIVDVSELDFMDSTGVNVLVAVRAALLARGGSLVLVAPQRLVTRVLGAMRADQLITVYGTVADAVAAS